MQSVSLNSYGVRRIPWLLLIALMAALATILWVTKSSLHQLHEKWTRWDEIYSHGYLLVFVCSYYIFRDLATNVRFIKHGYLYSFLILIPALAWSFGHATQIGVLQHMSLPLFLACLILPVVGLRRAVSMAFPFVLMYLAIPIWEVLTSLLQNMTVLVSSIGIKLLDIPAFINGQSFSLPAGTVVVATSCSGLNFFLMGIVLSSINCLHHRFSIKHSLLTILLMAGLALVGNWVRVYSLILIAYYSDMQHSLVYQHGPFGWWIFAGLFVLYLWLIRRVPGQARPQDRDHSAVDLKSSLPTLALTLLLAVSIPVWVQWVSLQVERQHRSLALPEFTVVSPESAKSRLNIHYSGFDIEEYFRARIDGREWLVGRQTYDQQAQGKELISVSNYVSKHSAQTQTYRFASGLKVKVEVIEGRTDKLVISSFIIGSQFEINDRQGKLLQFRELLAGRSANAFWYATTNCASYRCEAELLNLDRLLEPVEAWLRQAALY